MYSKVYIPQYDYLTPTLVTEVLELPYLMNSDKNNSDYYIDMM